MTDPKISTAENAPLRPYPYLPRGANQARQEFASRRSEPPRPAYSPVIAERSQWLMFGVLGLLVLGGIFAYSLPAVYATATDHASLRIVERNYPRAWLVWVAHLGIIAAAIAAVAYDTSNRRAQAWWITAGCLLTLPFLFSLLNSIGKFHFSVHLGSGIWLAMVCFGIAAAVPWIALKQAEQ